MERAWIEGGLIGNRRADDPKHESHEKPAAAHEIPFLGFREALVYASHDRVGRWESCVDQQMGISQCGCHRSISPPSSATKATHDCGLHAGAAKSGRNVRAAGGTKDEAGTMFAER